ncbi:MAG TPA: hypothetical protein DEZ08_06010 [Dehalococcoidia bacterium]|jgi:MFS family permease|nr:hypothetical protein [Dehalococcoidia bacterium]
MTQIISGLIYLKTILQSLNTFKSHNFRALWASSYLEYLSQGIQQVLLGWVAYQIDESVVSVGIIFAIRQVPFLFGGITAGILSDILDRRMLIIGASLSLSAVSLTMGFLSIYSELTLLTLSMLTLLLGTANSFQITTRHTFAYQINNHNSALNAMALINLSNRLGGITGSILAGILIATISPGYGFYLMSVIYILSSLIALLIKTENTRIHSSKSQALSDIFNYLKLISRNKAIQVLLISITFTEIFGFSYQVLIPVLVAQTLGAGGITLGVLNATKFIGGIFSTFMVVSLKSSTGNIKLIVFLIIGFGVGQFMLSASNSLIFMILAVFVINAMAGATDIVHQTLIQSMVGPEERGKAMGTWVVGAGIGPVGHLEVAYLGNILSSKLALIINGSMLVLLAAVVTVLNRAVTKED